MIIVGAYPDMLVTPEKDQNSIPYLKRFLDQTSPQRIAVHLLPFFPTSGDFGFSIDDWYNVRPELGSWSDVRELAASRNVIVDGVYNHVGIGHEWVRRFKQEPVDAANLLHAYRIDDPQLGPISPRGAPVLRRYEIAGDVWHLWQTFVESSVDIRLDNSVIRQEIDKQLALFSKNEIWGVRLDAVAYYSKSLGSSIRHNAGVFEIADAVAAAVERHGMRVFAQLDCDADGLRYFSDASQSHYVINDFSYCAYLALSILSGDPNPIATHLVTTARNGRLCLRSPRNHDGILLRSGLLDPIDRSRLIDIAQMHGLKIRTEQGRPYEINGSAPFLYSLASSKVPVENIVELSVAVTGMTSGWAYFYLPFLIGHLPEAEDSNADPSRDPRALNRTQISASVQQSFLPSACRLRIYGLLDLLSEIHAPESFTSSHLPAGAAAVIEDGSALCLELLRGKYRLIANFSSSQSFRVSNHQVGDLVFSNRLEGDLLAPLSYGIWRLSA